jgi:hypothetical protein
LMVVGIRFDVECDPVAGPVFLDRDMWERSSSTRRIWPTDRHRPQFSRSSP